MSWLVLGAVGVVPVFGFLCCGWLAAGFAGVCALLFCVLDEFVELGCGVGWGVLGGLGVVAEGSVFLFDLLDGVAGGELVELLVELLDEGVPSWFGVDGLGPVFPVAVELLWCDHWFFWLW